MINKHNMGTGKLALDAKYWNDRYQEQQTGWDIGHANHGLIDKLKELTNHQDKILIPGAGNAHEALALWRAGYTNTYVCDWAPLAFENLKREIEQDDSLDDGLLTTRMLVADFFKLKASFDFILEQTFFCAIDPSLRERYVDKVSELLAPSGTWVGVLFNRIFEHTGPPFGGNAKEYKALFSKRFNIQNLSTFEDSIPPRKGHEVLGIMHCKS